MTSTLVESEEQVSSSLKTPGIILAQRRAELGLSKEVVANRLHLRVKVVELLEADDYENMPEMVFVRGYIRAYANLLDLSGDEVMALFNDYVGQGENADRAEGVLWQNKKQHVSKATWFRWLTLLLLFISIIAASLWWHNNSMRSVAVSQQEIIKKSEEPVSTTKVLVPGMDKLKKATQLAENKAIKKGTK